MLQKKKHTYLVFKTHTGAEFIWNDRTRVEAMNFVVSLLYARLFYVLLMHVLENLVNTTYTMLILFIPT